MQRFGQRRGASRQVILSRFLSLARQFHHQGKERIPPPGLHTTPFFSSSFLRSRTVLSESAGCVRGRNRWTIRKFHGSSCGYSPGAKHAVLTREDLSKSIADDTSNLPSAYDIYRPNPHEPISDHLVREAQLESIPFLRTLMHEMQSNKNTKH